MSTGYLGNPPCLSPAVLEQGRPGNREATGDEGMITHTGD